MPVPWIHILGVPFPVPFILMMWIITVATITFYAVSEIKVEAQRARDANIEDGFEQNEFDWAGPDCLQFNNPGDYWSYRWCHEQSVAQLRYDKTYTGIEAINAIDMFLPDQSSRHEEYIEQWFISTQSDCVPLNSQDGVPKQRTAVATIYCCEDQPLTPQHLIAGISEPQPCHYRFDICALDMCGVLPATLVHIDSTNSFVEANTIKKSSKSGMQKLNWKKQKTQPAEEAPPASKSQSRRDISSKKISLSMFADRPLVDSEMQGMLRERAKQMFIHGYDAYMNNAFPNSELAAVSCKGQLFDPIKLPLVTLIDTLDTLVVMHNYTEFCKAVKVVENYFSENLFEFDVNVSVFETTIRLLGGLLSGHMLATDEQLGIYRSSDPVVKEQCVSYEGGLLRLAIDLGDRLYPAFSTATGIPYGTVNLKSGVPPGETAISSTAGAGSLLLEFEVLSQLSGIQKYGAAAKAATDALVSRRSDFGLYGKHINIKTGKWAETASGIGSNSDSFYEYIIKSHFLFGTPEYDIVFAENYLAVKRFNQMGDWFVDVDMNSGQVRRQLAENLQAFWPGVESSLGLTRTSARFLNALYSVLSGVGFMPEEFDYLRWQLPAASAGSSSYLLRPELIESTYLHYRSTHDRSWLTPAKWFLESLDINTKTHCGFSVVGNVDGMGLEDSMPSYFLAETMKYLYLLFDEDNFIHSRPFIFSTEAHMFDALELSRAQESFKMANYMDDDDGDDEEASFSLDERKDERGGHDLRLSRKSSFTDMLIRSLSKCPRKMWWEKEGCFDAYFEDQVGSQLGKSFDSEKLRDIPSHIRHNPHEELFCPPRLFNYLSSNDYASTFDIASTRPRGGTCAATDEIFHKLAGDSLSAEDSGSIKGETDNKTPESVAVGPDYFSFEELRADGGTVVQTVTFEGTSDGDFVVDIYSNGFSVYSVRHENLLHIFNLGETTVFATERDSVKWFDQIDKKVKSHPGVQSDQAYINDMLNPLLVPENDKSLVIGEVTGYIHRCSVQLSELMPLIEADEADLTSEIIIVADLSHNAYFQKPMRASDISPLSEKIFSKEMCSPAVFGRTSIEYAHAPVEIVAPVAVSLERTGCSPEPILLSQENGNDGSEVIRPYEGKILLVARGKCTFEEKALYAQSAGAAGVVVINTENFIFTMGGTAESEIKIELSPDSQTDQKSLFEMFKKVIQQSAGGANLNPFFPEVHILSAGENPIDESALDTLTAIVDNGGDIKNDITSALLDSVGTLKSSLSTAASSAISALASIHTGSSPINRVLIPTVMVSNRYGNALLKSYHHLVSKGKQPQLIIRADSQENSMDTVMNEGVDAKGEQEAGRFPKMRIERDIANEGNINGVRLWTKKSWGAVIQRNNQGTFELRIAGKADKEKSMLGSGQGLTERIGAQFSYASPGILSINPVDAYNLLINKVCDGSIYPKGSKVYMKSSITAFNGFDDIS